MELNVNFGDVYVNPAEIINVNFGSDITYSLSGTVAYNNVISNNNIVRLYDRQTGTLIAQTTSDTNGNFIFTNILDTSLKYLICLDKNSPIIYNSLIKDRVLLGGTPEEGDYI